MMDGRLNSSYTTSSYRSLDPHTQEVLGWAGSGLSRGPGWLAGDIFSSASSP
jgi:hypothetical protein